MLASPYLWSLLPILQFFSCYGLSRIPSFIIPHYTGENRFFYRPVPAGVKREGTAGEEDIVLLFAIERGIPAEK
jgi:hypothetical protein